MTYPGESIRLDSAYDVGATDWGLWDDVAFRDGSRTLASSGHWKLFVDTYFFTDHIYLTGSDAAVVSWVVEVTSGSVTVTAAEGLDPGFGDGAFTAGTALGSHVLTAGTNVIPSTFTAADIYDMTRTFPGVPMLDLVGTSGSAVVQQVKLRVWPVGGPVGGYVTMPGFTLPPAEPTCWVDPGGSVETLYQGLASEVVAREESWDAAAAALVAASGTNTGPFDLESGHDPGVGAIISAEQAGSEILGIDAWNSEITVQANILVVRGVNAAAASPIGPTLAEGVDWWRHPNEVYGDVAYYAVSLGTPSVAWLDASATAYDPSSPGDLELSLFTLDVAYSNAVSVTVDPGPTDTVTGATFDPYGSGIEDGDTVSLSPDGYQYIVVSLAHTAMTTPLPYPGPVTPLTSDLIVLLGTGTITAGVIANPITSYAVMPSYQVWTPEGAVIPPMRLMQRNDGLGMGSGRVLGPSTRQASVRVLGTY